MAFRTNEFPSKGITSILYSNHKERERENQIRIRIICVIRSGWLLYETMLQQEFDASGLPSLKPYLNYLIDRGHAEHIKVKRGKGH